MSRLSDLLNPAPSPQPTPRPIDVSAAEAGHGRNASITSPLEALALAATTQSPSITSLGQPTSGPLPPLSHSHPPLSPQSNLKYTSTHISEAHPSASVKQEIDTSSLASNTLSAQQNSKGEARAMDSSNETQVESGADQNSLEATAGNDRTVDTPVAPSIMTEVKKEPETNPSTPAVQSPTVLPTTEGKKRPAPKPSKKGTASVIKKPAPKKRKVETQSKDGTPMSQRSGTPNSSRASKTPAPKARKRNSATPAQSSPPRSVEGDDEEADDDGELFCICRKPDDHKWMIGCDGGCDDWFHGKCVDMKEEDAELIDKYICPNCTLKGIGVTTWKPMCRLTGCREPARANDPSPSKYCCDEHGEEFMRQKIFGKGALTESSAKKKKVTESSESSYGQLDGADESRDTQAHLRGGYLQPSELKSLTSNCKDVSSFKRLGESVLSADNVSSIPGQDSMETDEDNELLCTTEERPRLEEIKAKQAEMKHRLGALQDKEKFLTMVRARAAQTLAELKEKPFEGKKKDVIKDICGFDSRLIWSDVEFDEWRQSSAGAKVLESNVLGPPETGGGKVEDDGDTSMADQEKSDPDEIGRGVCQKKKCDKHRAWYRLHQQEIGSEKAECNHQLQRLDLEAKSINERAMLKRLESEAEARPGMGVTADGGS